MAAVTCPHCSTQNDANGAHCEHWICSKDEGLLEFLVREHVAKDFDPEKLEKNRVVFEREINKWAQPHDDAWFTRTDEGEKMRRKLQQSLKAMSLSYKVN